MNVQEFKEWCIYRHDVFVNQKYDDNIQYSKHLEFVDAACHRFKHLLKPWADTALGGEFELANKGCWGHDLIEDARVTYNDIVNMVGKTVAEIIFCCTEDKGRTRDERHSEAYYNLLATNRLAIFVKLCDIIGNTTYSLLTNSGMYRKHKAEHEKTRKYLYLEEFDEMFLYLDDLFKLK